MKSRLGCVKSKYAHVIKNIRNTIRTGNICGDGDIETTCKQVLVMLLRDVVNLVRLAAKFDNCSLK